MKVLFIHQNFPGQFLHWSAELAKSRRNSVVALGMEDNLVPKGVTYRKYGWLRPSAPETHPLLQDLETQALRAEACAAAAMQLKREGFEPDLVIAHPGWGEALFAKDVFPKARLIVYCEFYYAAEGRDVGFDPEAPPLTFPQRCRLRLRNTANLHALEAADAAIAPTQWQKSTFPAWAQQKIQVIHDGIDYDALKPNPRARLTLAATEHHHQLTFKPGDEVLSYVSRNLDPVRGFHIFMRALPEVQKRRTQAHAIIVGGDGNGYGHAPPDGGTWREHMLREVGDRLDIKRVHFLGKIPYGSYLNLLHISKAHAYWTTPFVLSWSFLEAAGAGTPLIASATPPVMEFAKELGVKTLPFFDVSQFSEVLKAWLAKPRVTRKPRHCVAAGTQKATTVRHNLISLLMGRA